MKWTTELTLHDAPVTITYVNGGLTVMCGGEDVTDNINGQDLSRLHMIGGEGEQEDMVYDNVGTLVPAPEDNEDEEYDRQNDKAGWEREVGGGGEPSCDVQKADY